MKVAKAYTGRDAIIVFQNGYHGRNMGAMMFSTSGVRARLLGCWNRGASSLLGL